MNNLKIIEQVDKICDAIRGSGGGGSVVSDVWDATATYQPGEYVIYQNLLYKCLATTTPGVVPSEGIYWTITRVSDEIEKITSDIDSKLSTFDNRNRNSTSANIITFPDIRDLRIKCSAGFASGAIYGFMQNVGSFAVNIYGNGGNIGLSDLQGNIVSLGLISVNRYAQDVGNELSINSSNYFNGIFIGTSI